MSTASAWIGLVSLVLFLGLISGFWAGLIGLWRARRGAARSLMAIGITLGTIGPVLLIASQLIFMRPRPGTPPPNFEMVQLMMMIGMGLIPISLLVFAVGFALHGFAMARMANRAEELEQLTVAMSEEINRLREGGPAA